MKPQEDPWRPMKTHEDPWRPMKAHEFTWNPMKSHEATIISQKQNKIKPKIENIYVFNFLKFKNLKI